MFPLLRRQRSPAGTFSGKPVNAFAPIWLVLSRTTGYVTFDMAGLARAIVLSISVHALQAWQNRFLTFIHARIYVYNV